VLACIVVYAVSWIFPKAFQFVSFFADVQYWPKFVALALGVMFTVHGFWTGLAAGGLLAAMDGLYWEQNY